MKNYSLLLVGILIATPNLFSQPQTNKFKPVVVKTLIERISTALNDNYVFPDKSKLMSDHLRSQFRKGNFKAVTDPKQIAEHIEKDLHSVHHDGHLRMSYDPEFEAQLSTSRPSPVQAIDSAAIQREKDDNFAFKRVEILNGNIGYIKFNGFSGMTKEATPTISAAFRFLANSNAIIIDLRKNGGGSPWMVRQIASYFYQERTRLNDIYERQGDKTVEFWAEPGDAENMKLSMPLYILTSKGTFSAAEDFTYAMQVNKRAVVVGETTGGGAHPTRSYPVGQGFIIDIPFARSINHITKTDWEGTGVIPDVSVTSDDALKEAQRLILTSQLHSVKNDDKKKQIGWLLKALDVGDYSSSYELKIFESYVGEYGRFSISMKENKLYLHDFIGRTFLLNPINSKLFLADDWLQIEFVLSENNNIKMKMMGKPGWVDIFDKN